MLVIENLSKELDSITKAHWIIKSDISCPLTDKGSHRLRCRYDLSKVR